MAVDLKERVVRTGLDPRWKEGGMEVEMDRAVDPSSAAEKSWGFFSGKRIQDSERFWHRKGQELPWSRSILRRKVSSSNISRLIFRLEVYRDGNLPTLNTV